MVNLPYVGVMDTLAQVLGGFGVFGIFAAFLLGMAMLLVLPIWAILHCLASDRPGGSKLFLTIALVVTWGVGAVFYAVFISGSRPFRWFTVAAVLIPIAILVPSIAGLLTGTAIHGRAQAERDRVEREALAEGFRPEDLGDVDVEPFLALHFTETSGRPIAATLADFTSAGPGDRSSRAVDSRVRHVAHDPALDRHFALTEHEFGSLAAEDGTFHAIQVDAEAGEFHWPKGIAYDSRRNRITILTSHVETGLWSYEPEVSRWRRLPVPIRGLPLLGLAYSDDRDRLYAVEHRTSDLAIRRMHRFNAEGALLGSIDLDPPVPVRFDRRKELQLAYSSGFVVLILPPEDDATARLLLFVDPSDGRVRMDRPALAIALAGD